MQPHKQSSNNNNMSIHHSSEFDVCDSLYAELDLDAIVANYYVECSARDTSKVTNIVKSDTDQTQSFERNAELKVKEEPTHTVCKVDIQRPTALVPPIESTNTNLDINGKMTAAFNLLHQVFKHDAFRPKQEEILREAFSSRDVFVLMPTGGGKSLCYQLPACVDYGVTIVISPLIALVEDQHRFLQTIGVRVLHLSGDANKKEDKVMAQVLSEGCCIKMLFVTPEKIQLSGKLWALFESLDKTGRLARFVVDEVHCICQWGHDFRPAYYRLGRLRTKFPKIPFMILTATATSENEAEVAMNLQLNKPYLSRSSFNRPNIFYEVQVKTSRVMDEVASIVRDNKNESGIVYCLSRPDCEAVAQSLAEQLGCQENESGNVMISYYHAGLKHSERTGRQNDWHNGRIKVMVATIAFGMGINKPDVRYVIHHSLPESITNYYQESGRAGRDGKPAKCTLFYSPSDLPLRQWLINRSRNTNFRETRRQELHLMTRYCTNQMSCLRSALLGHFGEALDSNQCGQMCSNCDRQHHSNLKRKRAE